jgi:predicted ATP-dependent protease
MDQNGRAQAIGGVNEKIEGFFDACTARGLTGRQGVIIPATNVEHLMLREDVVAAVREGRFRVWTVSSVDEAIEILTGVEAGVRDAEGNYGEGTINARVQARLDSFLAKRREFSKPAVEDGGRAAPKTEPATPAPTPSLPEPEKGDRRP